MDSTLSESRQLDALFDTMLAQRRSLAVYRHDEGLARFDEASLAGDWGGGEDIDEGGTTGLLSVGSTSSALSVARQRDGGSSKSDGLHTVTTAAMWSGD